MPNPWDVGTARVLVQLGFPAIATTSAGFAWSGGRRDHDVPLELMLSHLRSMAEGVDVPVNADFEGGFAIAADRVADHVIAVVDCGIAGLSIEDSSDDSSAPLFEFALAVDRIRAARRAIDARGGRVILTARSEGFIAGRPDLAATMRRLPAYAEAGADCLYAPGLRELTDIQTVVRAVAPKPVNVLVSSAFTTVGELTKLGVRRISVGGALSRTAWGATIQAAKEIAERGTFTAFGAAVPPGAMNDRFR